MAYRAYEAYAAYVENDTLVRSRSGAVYEGIRRLLSVSQLCGISERPHLPIIGYFDIPSNFVKTQDHP